MMGKNVLTTTTIQQQQQQQPWLQQKVLLRRFILVLFITALYISARTFYEYRAIKLEMESAQTTAVGHRGIVSEEAFMEKLQGIIREEVRSLHTREQLKSEKLISRLAGEYKASTVANQCGKQQPGEVASERRPTNSPFSFRLHINLSRLFNF